MYKYIVLGVLGLVIAASAQPFLEEDDDFLGIPGLETLSNGWFIRQSDSTEMGFHFPIDADILKLSSTDYRLIVLDGYGPHFTVMPIPQNYDLSLCSAIRSGEAPDTCAYAVSTCLMQSGAYFNPSTDRVAVAFQYGAAIGIYTFNPATGEFALERIFRNEAITKPVGIFWAFDQFFISDEVTQSVHRTDNYGTTVSNYGAEGDPWTVRYYWIGDISGYVDATGTAQMYVTDGTISRIDHLMATSGSPDIVLHSQAGRSVQDTTGFHLHESAVMPGLGPVAFDRYKGRFYLYESLGSLATAQRMATEWPRDIIADIVLPTRRFKVERAAAMTNLPMSDETRRRGGFLLTRVRAPCSQCMIVRIFLNSQIFAQLG